MSKINQAIELCKDSSKNTEFTKGLSLFNELIMNRMLSPSVRIKAFTALLKIAPDESYDKLSRMRDSIPFLFKEPELEGEINLLKDFVTEPQVNSHERLLCAVCLYNNNFIEHCYELFSHIANDISMLIEYRIEATRYLLYSEQTNFVKTARKCLIGFISSKEYPSSFKYKIIASFITTSGLSTLLNLEKLNVTYSEKFLFAMQRRFFWDDVNDTRERILSGQHMLDMKTSTLSLTDKDLIVDKLLHFSKNSTGRDQDDTDNIRADAADVVLRLGNEEQQKTARMIISDLGFMFKGDKKIKTLSQKSKTTYSDKQNVHDESINKSINDFIVKLVTKKRDHLDTFQIVHSEVTNLIYNSNTPSIQRVKAFKSLNRISIDTATFTDYKVSVAEIFVHIWNLIKKHESDVILQLNKRLLEESIDMADTCSSGHASRLINILSGYDVELKISWESQIHANMAARMQKNIQNIEDEVLQEKVALGMADDAEEEDKDAFIKFITENIQSLKDELYKEFVIGGYISKEEFKTHFETGTSEWI